MAQYYPPPAYGQASAQNLQFFPSSYISPVSGHSTPSQAAYGTGFIGGQQAASAYPGGVGGAGGAGTGGYGFGTTGGLSGRMGEQSGLRTGWLAAFGTEGYEGEPPLLEELGVNFEHIRTKVSFWILARKMIQLTPVSF